MANWDVILLPLNSNCTYFLDRITSNNFCVLQWCNLSAQHNETWLILAIWDKPCMFRQNITWWIGSISYKNKLSLTICFTQQQQKLPFTRNPVELCEFEDLKESFQGANLLLDLQITEVDCPTQLTFIFKILHLYLLASWLKSELHIYKTSQDLRMLSPSLFIQGSQCKC